MTVRLRAHHLLCMLTYVGRGYSPAFVENYDGIVIRLGRGEPIQLVDGPDDICAPIEAISVAHCHNQSVVERDRLARAAVGDLLGPGCDLGKEFRLDSALLSRFRVAFGAGHTRAACSGCEWSGLCDHVAGADFSGTKLQARTD